MAQASRDDNRVPTLLGVSDIDKSTPTTIAVNPTTHAMIIDGTSLYAGLDTHYLKLDQTTPQTLTIGAPIFNMGIDSNNVIRTFLDGTDAFQVLSATTNYSKLSLDVVTDPSHTTEYTYIQSVASGTGTLLPISFWVNSGVGAIRAMDISTTGKIGIGTVNPDTALHVAVNDATSVLRLERNDTTISTDDIVGRIEIETKDTTDPGICAKLEAISYGSSGETGWRFSGGTPSVLAELVRIDNTGAMGIGVTDPAEKLQVKGNVMIGDGEASTDYSLTFDGQTNNGIIVWMEDEDYFHFQDAIKTTGRMKAVTTKTTTYTATIADEVIVCNSTTAFTVTLPVASGSGQTYHIKSINTGAITVSKSGDTIDGETSMILNQWDSIIVCDTGSNLWNIL